MVCSELKVEVLSGAVAKDHVQMLVSLPPQLSVSKLEGVWEIPHKEIPYS
jgi:REP element-mobilizing transposase RayT